MWNGPLPSVLQRTGRGLSGGRVIHDDEPPFSITRGGPFYELLRRCKLVDARGNIRVLRLVAIVWLPLALGTLLRLARGAGFDAIVADPSVHVRILICIPLLIIGEQLLETRC